MPPDRSRSTLRESQPIGELVSEVLEEYRIGLPSIEETITQNWDTIVGAANAGFVDLLKIENGRRVLIAVSNPIVRQELFFHRKLILDRIRELPGCSGIRSILLRAG
ncbi:MAG TPA: DUF721 domain-containing protein [Opitutales bacterium]|nr:DUF721 domain-containing protein [Opitutales bacterium]